jgi:lactose/L-arabinose transport system ATP-binding protein
VAIGRAIVRGPEVFLFDEPLSNLDAELRVEMRVEIARLHQEIGATMIYVTHDQVEAMTLADKIVVLRAGRIEQVGRPLDLYNDPDNRFVAGFIGSPAMNFFEGRASGGTVTIDGLGGVQVAAPSSLGGDGPVTVGLRPNHVRLADGDSHVVELSEQLGGVSYHYLTAPGGGRMIVEAHDQQAPRPGSRTGLAFDASDALFFDAKTEARLR